MIDSDNTDYIAFSVLLAVGIQEHKSKKTVNSYIIVTYFVDFFNILLYNLKGGKGHFLLCTNTS